MTARADPVTSVSAHPLQLLTNLTIALTREAEFYSRQLTRIDELIDVRVKGIEAEFEARTSGLRGDVRSALGAERHRTQRARWYTGVLALLAIVFGAILFYLAASMVQEMNRMTNYMESMRDDIGAMRLAIFRMDESTSAMAANVKAMTGSLSGMSRGMSNMDSTMGLLRQDTAMMRMGVGQMSNDTRSMGAPFRFMGAFMPW